MEQATKHDVLAAVDLGSNSFHMIIARLRDGHFQVVDRLREMVQLRAGLDENNNLTAEASEKAIACLQRFGERVKDLPTGSVRVVGTNTLRVAKNSRAFLSQARQALGHPIEIIAGEEEARLIYLGVAHALAFDDARRLVIDIGGGSTEFIIGEGFTGLRRESLGMGCVSFSKQFFEKGEITKSGIKAASIAAGRLLRDIQRPYRKMGWLEVVGASGTIRAVATIVSENDWADDGVITPKSLDNIIEVMLEAGHVDKLTLAGLSDERSNVMAGGVIVLKAAFDRLKIDRMIVSDGALREGLLYDLLGRIQHDDERERTVLALASRYQVDEEHAERVAVMVTQLFEQVADDWGLDDDALQRLKWAAKLHEIGLTISHDQFHKHSAYLLANSVLPGFSREEQHILSTIVLGQRRKFPKAAIHELAKESRQSSRYLTVLLRLAMVFNRGRSETADTFVNLKVKKKSVHLTLPEGWINDHPLTEADLLREAAYLDDVGLKMKLKD